MDFTFEHDDGTWHLVLVLGGNRCQAQLPGDRAAPPAGLWFIKDGANQIGVLTT